MAVTHPYWNQPCALPPQRSRPFSCPPPPPHPLDLLSEMSSPLLGRTTSRSSMVFALMHSATTTAYVSSSSKPSRLRVTVGAIPRSASMGSGCSGHASLPGERIWVRGFGRSGWRAVGAALQAGAGARVAGYCDGRPRGWGAREGGDARAAQGGGELDSW